MCACGGDEATGNIIETEEVETSQSPETETTEAVAQQVITTDDVVGTWILELPFKQGAKGVPAFQMDLHKGGTGEGYEKLIRARCICLSGKLKMMSLRFPMRPILYLGHLK